MLTNPAMSTWYHKPRKSASGRKIGITWDGIAFHVVDTTAGGFEVLDSMEPGERHPHDRFEYDYISARNTAIATRDSLLT